MPKWSNSLSRTKRRKRARETMKKYGVEYPKPHKLEKIHKIGMGICEGLVYQMTKSGDVYR